MILIDDRYIIEFLRTFSDRLLFSSESVISVNDFNSNAVSNFISSIALKVLHIKRFVKVIAAAHAFLSSP